jgi:hypothetical protein
MTSSVSTVIYRPSLEHLDLILELAWNPRVAQILLVQGDPYESLVLPSDLPGTVKLFQVNSPLGSGITRTLDEAISDYVLLIMPGERVKPAPRAIERLLEAAEDTAAGLVYSDFKDELDGELADHPLIDYKLGSIRDNFDFGSLILVSKRAADQAFQEHGSTDERLKWAGLYDLRLKLSIDSPLLRVPEPLYTRVPSDRRASGDRQFDYVDPRNREYQVEMEDAAAAHLERIGAYLNPEFQPRDNGEWSFPVRASVVIPVRNREGTIKDAVLSALSQQVPFDFNAIVVDNHSTDGTTDILADLARQHHNLVHLIPERHDLGIGGCWNQAIYSDECGEFAVQLDSDDLYNDEHTLRKIIAKFEEGPYAMVIGAYTIVDFQLQEIPPGLIDHSEWTRDNGRNNALRIGGLGAPRAFHVPTLRRIGFPNTSYGEDYAVALRISRHYEIGRLYESLYFARRWEGNSDAALSTTTANRYDAYKDHLRTVEMMARRRMNQK